MKTMTIKQVWKVEQVEVERYFCDIYLPATLVGARTNRIENAVSRDDIFRVFHAPDEDGVVFVVSCNRSLPYVGVEEFHLDPTHGWVPCLERSIFAQEERVIDVLGPNYDDLTFDTVCRRMLEYAHDRCY